MILIIRILYTLKLFKDKLMSDKNERLMALIARVLNVDARVLKDETTPDDIDSWDSFNGLMMVSELESEFSVSFTIEEVYAVACVKDIREALIRHGITF